MLSHILRYSRRFAIIGFIGLIAALLSPTGVIAQVGDGGETLVVSPDGPYTSISDALENAYDGDTIEVHGGSYPAPITILKTVNMIGINNPVIDGEGEDSLVLIGADDVIFRGFTLRNSGNVQHREDAGIVIEAANVTIEDNVLDEVLYGIFFANAHNGIARNNMIHGIDNDPALRGDGIRVWYSNDVTLDSNEVINARDTLIWYSDNITITDNIFRDNRYGLHFMYCNYAVVTGNIIEENSVGAFLMYSRFTTITDNTFAYNRGPSGYGLALKDMDDVTSHDNFFVGNRAGVYLDNSPALVDSYNTFDGNIFAYNDVGVTSLPSVQRNVFQANSFLKNIQQVSMRGREIVSRNIWSQDGIGNYWSDYVGYDENGDGFGEMPYRSEALFESLVDEYPSLQLFAYSPASQTIEFVGSAFPILRPQPKLVDESPMMHYEFPAYLTRNKGNVSTSLLLVSLAIIGSTLGVNSLFIERKKLSFKRVIVNTDNTEEDETMTTSPNGNTPISQMTQSKEMIIVKNLTKRYGKHTVLNNVSFNVKAGESVAIWGINGAGKTTTLRCLLGMQSFDGNLSINEIDVKRDGKAARKAIGYVPQEAAFYDMSVLQTLTFYARLNKVDLSAILPALEEVGLNEHQSKAVKALSGGMKQRLALAVSLLGDPPVLLLDEPTANLDTQARRDFLNLIQTLNQRGKTIMFSTHRVEEVLALASRVLVLKDGDIIVDCHPTKLMENLGLQQWLRVSIAKTHWDGALEVLNRQGFQSTPNGNALYVQVGTEGKMLPLRALEAADIRVEDFDIVDENIIDFKGKP